MKQLTTLSAIALLTLVSMPSRGYAQNAPPTTYPRLYAQAQPAYGQAQPTYGQAQPTYQPAPVYGQPQPQPRPEPIERSRPNLGLTISGAVMLGVSYVLHAFLVSPLAGCDPFGSCEGEWSDFRLTGLIPLAGPWLQLWTRPSSDHDAWPQYLVIDGILQTAGLTLLILGLTLRETTTSYARADGASFAIAPMVGPDANGIAAVGRF